MKKPRGALWRLKGSIVKPKGAMKKPKGTSMTPKDAMTHRRLERFTHRKRRTPR